MMAIVIIWVPTNRVDQIQNRVIYLATLSLSTTDNIEIVTPSDYNCLTERIRSMFDAKAKNRNNVLTQTEIKYKHLENKWPYHKCKNRATETTITRFRLLRSRLRDDLKRWNLVESNLCPRCLLEPETPEHYFLHCNRLTHERASLMQICGTTSNEEMMQLILTGAHGYSPEYRAKLQDCIEKYLAETGIIPPSESA
jgi:transposase-like protein